MEPTEADWEGFESFNDDSLLPSAHPPAPRSPSPPHSPQQGQEKMVTLHKKLTFRSKNRRKNSFASPLPAHPARKNSTNLQLTTTMPQKILPERSKRTAFSLDKREDGIPIFHEGGHRTLQGQLVYRRQPLPTAEEELSRNSRIEGVEGCGCGEEVRFESRFESGNLEQAVRVGNEYHLYVAADTNTRGHRQWFYFTAAAPTARALPLTLHSFRKKLSLFQIGMRPYGKRRNDPDDAWKPIGRNVRYYRTDRGRNQPAEFALSFEVELQKDEELCIASCIPYSYSLLRHRLALLPNTHTHTLCKTLTGLDVPLLTLNAAAAAKPHHRYLIINARTHPGESSASWVADGLMHELANSPILQGLLAEFKVVVKIVPMLNVEGVCLGNYRTGTMGMDFNRLFLSGTPDLFPEIAALKRLVEECKARGEVDLFLDLHGHSILPGCFMYGPDPVFAPKTALRRLVREMGKSKYFARGHCVQGVNSAKAETSRIYFQVQEGVFSLTCENSLGMYCRGGQKGKETQFEARDWQEFGKDLISIILNIYDEYANDDAPPERNELEEALSLIRSAEEEEFVWEKSKTDLGKMQDELALLNELELDEIDLPRQLTLSQDHAPEETASLNDSDASSEDLSFAKQQELIKIVRKTLSKQTPAEQAGNSPSATATGARQDPRATLSMSRGKFINNFKEYRFGVEDTTISDWYTRKRLFSVPKHLKNERQGQSYLIRKKLPLPNNAELAAEPAEIGKRVRTEERELRRTSVDRFSNKEFVNRQKILLENLLTRKF